MEEGRGVYGILVGRPVGREPLWEDLGVGVQWWAFVNTVMKFQVHKESHIVLAS
jgi:hypothetical protein